MLCPTINNTLPDKQQDATSSHITTSIIIGLVPLSSKLNNSSTVLPMYHHCIIFESNLARHSALPSSLLIAVALGTQTDFLRITLSGELDFEHQFGRAVDTLHCSNVQKRAGKPVFSLPVCILVHDSENEEHVSIVR
jgi:hypothetical protein